MSVSGNSSQRNAVTTTAGYVPVIDVGYAYTGDPAERAEVAQAIADACRSSGFFMIRGHQVPRRVVDEMREVTARFFALPQVAKLELLANPHDPLMRGFAWPARPRDGQESAAALFVPPDLSESFVVNRYGDERKAPAVARAADKRLLFPNKWPELPGFEATYDAYYGEMERLAMDIMRLFATALGLPLGWFDGKFDSHMTSLSANYYPPQLTSPQERQLRKAAHTDWGTLTVLYQDDDKSGLQVWHEERGWVDVPPVAGTFVVNIGDLMARWTNDIWSSTVHRVVNPPPDEARQARYSVAFFHQPNYDAVITCIPTCADPVAGARHRPVRSFDYISVKARRAYMEDRVVLSKPPRSKPGP